jgi:hypothetical protein
MLKVIIMGVKGIMEKWNFLLRRHQCKVCKKRFYNDVDLMVHQEHDCEGNVVSKEKK